MALRIAAMTILKLDNCNAREARRKQRQHTCSSRWFHVSEDPYREFGDTEWGVSQDGGLVRHCRWWQYTQALDSSRVVATSCLQQKERRLSY